MIYNNINIFQFISKLFVLLRLSHALNFVPVIVSHVNFAPYDEWFLPNNAKI
jgi:hypothetical protein